MNAERAHEAVEETLREYVRARSNFKKDSKGDTYSSGMTIVSPDDKRISEMSRLAVEAVLRVDDHRPRQQVEVKALRLGDVFTRYSIKDGVAVDEEVTVVKVTSSGGRSQVRYRRASDALDEVSIDSTYLLSVVRPTEADLRAQLEEV